MPGPVPNRSDDLSRERDANRGDRSPITKGELRPVVVPHADPEWHPIADKLYRSLKSSGQSDFYQNSDWALAYSLCDDLSHFKQSGKRSAQMAQTIYSALSNLLVSEGDRRRVRIELSAPEAEEEPASVTAIDAYKKQLGVAN